MKIHLIRHADPDYINDTITPLGHQEAALLAEKFDFILDQLYTSPRGRAQDTCHYLEKKLRMPSTTLDWTAELNGKYLNRELYAWKAHENHPELIHFDYGLDDWHQKVPYGTHMKPITDELNRNFNSLVSKSQENDTLRARGDKILRSVCSNPDNLEYGINIIF